MSTTLPTPSLTTSDRGRRAEYTVGQLPDGSRRVVTLNASHSKDAKRFAAILRTETVEEDGLRSFRLFSGVVLGRESVSRYSARALDAFFDRMRAELERRKDEPAIAEMFTAVTSEESASDQAA